MLAKITKTLVSEIVAQAKPYEINDTELRGFIVRVQPSGIISYLVSYRYENRRNRVTIGQHPVISVAQARDEAKKILAGKALGKDPNDRKRKNTQVSYTLESFIDKEYQTWCEANRKDGKATIARLKAAFSNLLSLPLAEITVGEVEHWRTNRLSSGISPATVNRDLNALKSLLSSAVRWGHSANRLDIKPSKVDIIGKVRYLSHDEEKNLLAVLTAREEENRRKRKNGNKWRLERGYSLMPEVPPDAFTDNLYPAILLSLHTGLRRGELLQLEWEDIDFERRNLTVRSESAKSSKARHVPLNNMAYDVLKRWRKHNAKAVHVFPGKDGDDAVKSLKTSWLGLILKAKITKFRWHDMRHTFASKLVMKGIDLNTVRELLGHSDIKMTLRYAHLAPEHKAAAVAALL
jgi:integrase